MNQSKSTDYQWNLTIKIKIKKIQSNEKVTEKKLPVTGKIVTKLGYSYFFRKVTKLLKKLQVT